MALTPSQKKHLAALTEHANRYGIGPTRPELEEQVYGSRKGAAASVARAINALESQGLVHVLADVNRGGVDTYSPTDAGREELARLGAAGGADEEQEG